RFWGTPRYLEHPYLSREAAVALAGMGCRLVGVDAPSVDPPGADLAAHIALLSAGVLIAENLVLAGLAGCRECVWCVVAPLRLEGGDGAPARAMALLGADRP
ncbi:MAG: cyclase family protein, partial [Clostridia bacterium]|nr:cyclase family protein [Clostridia bacterium]